MMKIVEDLDKSVQAICNANHMDLLKLMSNSDNFTSAMRISEGLMISTKHPGRFFAHYT